MPCGGHGVHTGVHNRSAAPGTRPRAARAPRPMAAVAAQGRGGTQTIQLKAIPLTPQSFQPFGQVGAAPALASASCARACPWQRRRRCAAPCPAAAPPPCPAAGSTCDQPPPRPPPSLPRRRCRSLAPPTTASSLTVKTRSCGWTRALPGARTWPAVAPRRLAALALRPALPHPTPTPLCPHPPPNIPLHPPPQGSPAMAVCRWRGCAQPGPDAGCCPCGVCRFYIMRLPERGHQFHRITFHDKAGGAAARGLCASRRRRQRQRQRQRQRRMVALTAAALLCPGLLQGSGCGCHRPLSATLPAAAPPYSARIPLTLRAWLPLQPLQVTQCLGCLGGQPWYMAVARPSGSVASYPQQQDLVAFRVPPGCFIKMHMGTWHAGGRRCWRLLHAQPGGCRAGLRAAVGQAGSPAARAAALVADYNVLTTTASCTPGPPPTPGSCCCRPPLRRRGAHVGGSSTPATIPARRGSTETPTPRWPPCRTCCSFASTRVAGSA
jgi:hypothetical protein